MKKFYTIILLIAILSVTTASAQFVIYGPEHEPPGGVFSEMNGTANDNLIGTTEGKIFTYSAIDFLNRTDVFYGTVVDSIKLSMDGADFSNDGGLMEVMVPDTLLSNPEAGSLVWKGVTRLADNPTQPVFTRFVMSFTSDGSPLPLIPADSLGLDPYVQAVPDLSPGITFSVKLQFQASYNAAGGYIPHIPFYDANSTYDALAYSSYGWGWYWINSAPWAEENMDVTVDEGDTVTVNSDFVLFDDVESDSTMVYLEVQEGGLPQNGMLYDNDMMVTEGYSFTSADLQNDSIVYVHDGSETSADSVGVRLYDSDGAYYTMDGDSTFYIRFAVTPVDDDPEVMYNEVLAADEGAETVITDSYLMATDSESDDADITFKLDPDSEDVWPKNGIIRKSGVPLSSGGTFTQADINSGLIAYKHDGSEDVTEDGFVFSVVDEFGHPADNGSGENRFFFSIDVNFVNDNPQFAMNVPTEMTEWESPVILATHLAATDEESPDTEIFFNLVSNPKFGHVEVDGTAIFTGENFTMQDLRDGVVKYVQTKNATEADEGIVFTITDGDGGMTIDGEYTDFKHPINITLTSAKDQQGQKFSFYPNPGAGIFNISGADDVKSLQVFNILGDEVMNIAASGLSKGTLDLTGQGEGVYLVKITTDQGIVLTERLVVR